MKIEGYTLTNHALVEREDRIVEILATTGFGKIISKMENKGNTVKALTSTGVCLIVDERTKTCVTLYKIDSRKIGKFVSKALV